MSEKLDGNLFPIPHFYRTVQLSIHELSTYAWKIDNANISRRYFRPNADTRRAKEHYAKSGHGRRYLAKGIHDHRQELLFREIEIFCRALRASINQ